MDTVFTDLDLQQEADLSGAEYLTVSDGARLVIESPGVYVLSGTAVDASVTVKAGKKDRVQLVLDGLTIVNESEPCISIQKADRVFITTTESKSSLEVTGYFTGSEKAVIYSGAGRKRRQGIDTHACLLPVSKSGPDPAECFCKGRSVHHAPAFSSKSRCSSSMNVCVSLNSLYTEAKRT